MEPEYKPQATSRGDEKLEYKPKSMYFLKVTPRGDETIESLSCDLLRLKNKNFSFGEFNDYVSSKYGIEPEFAVLEFFPNSKDLYPFACKYKTCEQALNAAIKKLNKAGLDATPFDLEDLINKIK